MTSSVPIDHVPAVFHEDGTSDFVLICEHASNYLPDEFRALGLSSDVLDTHVAWDIGALPVAQMMADRLDCPLIAANVSRLIVDCNRSIESPDSMPEKIESVSIPGNVKLTREQRQYRLDRFYTPFHQTVGKIIQQRVDAGFEPVIVTVHSFEHIYFGESRGLEIGILHDDDQRFADKVLRTSGLVTKFKTLRNEPYGPNDGVTHTLKTHAQSRGFLNVMIEIRNDLISTEHNQCSMADILSGCLASALGEMRECGHLFSVGGNG